MAGISSEQPVGPNPATAVQASCFEVAGLQGDGVIVVSSLTGDLAQDQIIALERRDNQSGPAFRLAEIREREVDDDNVAPYKSAQAASSSGVN